MGKKLIEVPPFLPLEAISKASKADKDKKTGTIKNVHKWFAPMPTPALRALIFAAVVDAPDDEVEHKELLHLVKRLVPENGNPPDEHTLEEVRDVIRKSTGGSLPTIFDPFCGGGSTLIEAQRLGLPAIGSDLNPVPVLITRTLTELIPQVAGRPPLVGDLGRLGTIGGGPLDGLFADVQHYTELVRGEVWENVSHLYPKGPNGETIVAWLWAWTAQCPNPVCGADLPLVSSMWLSKRRGQERWLEPIVDGKRVQFEIGRGPGAAPEPSKLKGAKFRCWVCGQPASHEIKDQAKTRGLGVRGLAVVTDSDAAGRQYWPIDTVAQVDVQRPEDAPDSNLLGKARNDLGTYGFNTWAEIHTNRQLVMLESFASAIARVPERVRAEGGDDEYAKTIPSILGLALGKLAQSNSTQVRWNVRSTGSSKAEPAFGRHAMPMVWDFVETNPFGGSVGDWRGQADSIIRGLRSLPRSCTPAQVYRTDARTSTASVPGPVVVVTDPPYFDQIGYADLSDYFYVWHRQGLRAVHPDLYRTIVTPKDEELIATPYRHGGNKLAATRYFVDGFIDTFTSLTSVASSDHPILIVYAHRQEETSSLGSASTGWDAMLQAVLDAGLVIEGTLPIHGSYKAKLIGIGTNALASYMVMVCRPRIGVGAPGTIGDFRSALRARLPEAARALLTTGESMVDIRHAAIGPGMEVFSHYSAVFDGSDPIPVHRALTIINEELGRLLDEQLGTVDGETRWACLWYADHGYEPGDYDEGRKAAQAFGFGIDRLQTAGVVESGGGLIRLLPRAEFPASWVGDERTSLWQATQHLVKRLTEGTTAGEESAADLLAALGARASGARELAQYLTNLAIEKGWSDDAIAYDALVQSWPRIEELATSRDGTLF